MRPEPGPPSSSTGTQIVAGVLLAIAIGCLELSTAARNMAADLDERLLAAGANTAGYTALALVGAALGGLAARIGGAARWPAAVFGGSLAALALCVVVSRLGPRSLTLVVALAFAVVLYRFVGRRNGRVASWQLVLLLVAVAPTRGPDSARAPAIERQRRQALGFRPAVGAPG